MNDNKHPEEPLIPTRFHRAVFIGMGVYTLLTIAIWFALRPHWLGNLNVGVCFAIGFIGFWLSYRRDERKNLSVRGTGEEMAERKGQQ